MIGNYQRTPIGESLNRISRDAANTQLQQSGKALPCTVVQVSGQFVTVKFQANAGPFTLPNITIPINTSEYDWLPIQVGDPGYTQPADITLANISGVSASVPQLVQRLLVSLRNQTRILKRKSLEVSAPTGHKSTVLSV